jgi:hypothetical protein
MPQTEVTAAKPLKWKGKTFSVGEVLTPQPTGPERANLINGRFVTLGESEED